MKIRNMLCHDKKVPKLCSAMLLLALTAGVAGAHPEEPRYTVAVISDSAHGKKILEQDYEKAIARLQQSDATGLPGFFKTNNLCVAYMKSGRLEAAQEACNAAVDRIRAITQISGLHSRQSLVDNGYRKYLAMALSNRGVLHAIRDQPELARQDFKAAIDTESRIRQPETNLARLTQAATPTA